MQWKCLKPFTEAVAGSAGHEEGTYAEIDHEEDILEVFQKS